MPDQDKIDNVTDQITEIIDKARIELAQDLLKLKKELSVDEFIKVLNTMDLKSILNKKVEKAKNLFIQHHRVVLEETIPFGDIDADK